MEFDKSKVYTMLNADELKAGSRVIVGDNLAELKECVLKHRLSKIIKKVEPEDDEHRFLCDDSFHYALAYLVSEPFEEPREKRIAELEQENAELKDKNRALESYADLADAKVDEVKTQLFKAKKIIKTLLRLWNDVMTEDTVKALIAEAEHFLKEDEE